MRYQSTDVSGKAHTACVFYMCVFAQVCVTHEPRIENMSDKMFATEAPFPVRPRHWEHVLLPLEMLFRHFLDYLCISFEKNAMIWQQCRDFYKKSAQNTLRLCTRCSSNDLISKCKLNKRALALLVTIDLKLKLMFTGAVHIHFNLLLLLNYLKHS